MGITTEQRLSICKFLAEKMKRPYIQRYIDFDGDDNHRKFNPFADPAQRMEVIDAAASNGIVVMMGMRGAAAGGGDMPLFEVSHNNTQESRAEAVLVAIAKAWGWEER